MSLYFNNKYIAVFYHIFYEDSLPAILEELQVLQDRDAVFFFNIVESTPGKDKIKEALRVAFKDSIIVFSSDKGKDIGGKLLLLSIYKFLHVRVKYFLFLHDKKSLHALNSKSWRSGLFKIVREDQVDLILNLFESDGTLGIVASKPYILEEQIDNKQRKGKNAEKLIFLSKKYSVLPPTYHYVAGTIFWVRASAYHDFFHLVNPLEIRRSLEEGNVLDNIDGTFTHSWERMLSWIVTGRGYLIKGV